MRTSVCIQRYEGGSIHFPSQGVQSCGRELNVTPKGTQEIRIHIAHLQRTSLIDYPGEISAVVFTQGCNFRCPYCHNPELVDPSQFTPPLDQDEVLSFLSTRREKCDAVVISGGEPCIQPGLVQFMKRLKEMKYLVKLDTNGSFPDVLSEVLESDLADFIAMDVKAPISRYSHVTRCIFDPGAVARSIRIIMRSNRAFEFRTTLVRELLSPEDVLEIGREIEGAPCYVLQRFVASKHVDGRFLGASSFSDEEIADLKESLREMVGRLIVR